MIHRRGFRAFTLVELLVVVGIIALLMAILIPVISRAKENASRAACASNLRQLGTAFLLYANDNRDRYPLHAEIGKPRYEDWIYWQRNRDPRQSRVAKYLGGVPTKLFRCPSDAVHSRILSADPYDYSYTMNMPMTSDPGVGLRPAIVSAIRRPAEKILIAEEDERSLDDGNFNPFIVGGTLENFLATRHDRQYQKVEARGNVCFSDAHVEFVARKVTQDKKYYDPWEP